MVRRIIASAGFAAVLLFASNAFADGERETVKGAEHRVEHLDRTMDLSRRGPVRADRVAYRHRHSYRHAYSWHHHRIVRGWDGRYGHGPRRHVFVTGEATYGLPMPVSVTAVTYRTYLYYTPTYPSVSYGYPPYARLYDLTPGPIYNRPCFC